jgi:hypothetical protein
VLPVRQLAYKVNDLEAAAAAHHRAFGSGPFFVLRHIALSTSVNRGVERPFDHSSAYGQWGEVMVELVVQYNPDPSGLHDMCTPMARAARDCTMQRCSSMIWRPQLSGSKRKACRSPSEW